MTIHLTKIGHGKPLVCFHGFGFDGQIFASLIPDMSKSCTLFLVDLPGFGKSPLMQWETFKRELLTKLPTSFALMGWSMGGLFATRLAIEVPDAVTHLMNVASSPYFVKQDQWEGIESSALTQFYEQMKGNIDKLNQFISLQAGHMIQLYEHIPQGLEYGLNTLKNWDLRENLALLPMPVGYLFGRLDAIVSHKVMTCMQAQYPQFSYYLFKKSAHAPFLSEQQAFITTMMSFLK